MKECIVCGLKENEALTIGEEIGSYNRESICNSCAKDKYALSENNMIHISLDNSK